MERKQKHQYQKGNQFWKLRSKHGRDKIFSSPQILWEQACEYFSQCDKNPLKAEKVFGTGKRMSEKRMVAYTLSGLCFYLKCDEDTFRNYGEKDEYQEFHEVVKEINQVIFTQKFTAAAANLLNANIISRDLGLKDSSDITTDGKSLNDAFASTLAKVKKNMKSNEND